MTGHKLEVVQVLEEGPNHWWVYVDGDMIGAFSDPHEATIFALEKLQYRIKVRL